MLDKFGNPEGSDDGAVDDGATVSKCEMKRPVSMSDKDIESSKELCGSDILSALDSKILPIDLSEWGGHAYIRVISGRERDKFEASCLDRKGRKDLADVRAKWAFLILCKKDGTPLFTSRGDIAKLAGKSCVPLDRIFNLGTDLNGMSQDDIDELMENSDAGQ